MARVSKLCFELACESLSRRVRVNEQPVGLLRRRDGQAETFPLELINQTLRADTAHLAKRGTADPLNAQILNLCENLAALGKKCEVGGANLAFVFFPARVAPGVGLDCQSNVHLADADRQEDMVIVFMQQPDRRANATPRRAALAAR